MHEEIEKLLWAITDIANRGGQPWAEKKAAIQKAATEMNRVAELEEFLSWWED